jgi:hypothetical protein
MGFNRWHHKNLGFRCSGSDVGHYPDRPFKPAWLTEGDGLDTTAIFKRCRGFISWGSPLETFARTWPQMVHLRPQPPFSPEFEWINLYDPVDVVASPLTSYDNLPRTCRPINFPCRSSLLVLSAHTSYFKTSEKNRARRTAPTVLHWMLQSEKQFVEVAKERGLKYLSNPEAGLRRTVAVTQWIAVLLIGLFIWPIVTGLFVRAIGFIPRQIAEFLTGTQDTSVDQLFRFIDDSISSLQPVPNLITDFWNAVTVIVIVGVVLSLGGIAHFVVDSVFARAAKREPKTGNIEIATAEYADSQFLD